MERTIPTFCGETFCTEGDMGDFFVTLLVSGVATGDGVAGTIVFPVHKEVAD